MTTSGASTPVVSTRKMNLSYSSPAQNKLSLTDLIHGPLIRSSSTYSRRNEDVLGWNLARAQAQRNEDEAEDGWRKGMEIGRAHV